MTMANNVYRGNRNYRGRYFRGNSDRGRHSRGRHFRGRRFRDFDYNRENNEEQDENKE